MNRKRIIIGTVVILALSAIFHGVYDHFPSFITSIFFPVNESIWEHNKLVILSFLIWSILEKTITKSGKSIFFLNFVSALICVIFLDSIFTPVYFFILKKKDNLALTLIIYAISIMISLVLGKKFLLEENKKIETIAILGYVIVFTILGVLTYYPIHTGIFYDYSKNFYGINPK